MKRKINKSVLPAIQRKKMLIDAGIKIAIERNISAISFKTVAVCAGVSHPLVVHYFGTVDNLRSSVINEAILRRNHKIVLELIFTNHPEMKKLPDDLRREALENAS